MARDKRRQPTHPGAVLRLDVLPGLAMTQEQFAKRLGVGRVTVCRLLNEHQDVSVEMALRLERALGTSAEVWLGMQMEFDLWEARKN